MQHSLTCSCPFAGVCRWGVAYAVPRKYNNLLTLSSEDMMKQVIRIRMWGVQNQWLWRCKCKPVSTQTEENEKEEQVKNKTQSQSD